MTGGSQPALFEGDAEAEVARLLASPENQWFDRKSARTKAADLAKTIIAMANADGGVVCIGISEGRIEGIDNNPSVINDWLQSSLDCTKPTVRVSYEFIPCFNDAGQADRLLKFEIEPSERVHRTKSGECYLRVGDESRKLGHDEERELSYDKGESLFDRMVIPDSAWTDLNQDEVQEYAAKMSMMNPRALLIARGLYVESGAKVGVTQAGLLLLGTSPPVNSYVRYIRHLGTTIETGVRGNVVEDVRLSGTIPYLIKSSRDLIGDRIGNVDRLSADGRFQSVPLLPEFVWLEAIVNAVTHRSYSIVGDGVRVRDFTDRLVVESPGALPGLVRVENIQNHRYSRNPNIARALGEMTGYVRELNEGVKRMFEEMKAFGLRPPEFKSEIGQVRVTLYKSPDEGTISETKEIEGVVVDLTSRLGSQRSSALLAAFRDGRRLKTGDVALLLGVSAPTARGILRRLEQSGLVQPVLQASTDPTRYWIITNHSFWARRG